MTTQAENAAGSDVCATVNYIRNRPDSDTHPLEFVTEVEEWSTMQTTPGREVQIRNARGIPTALDVEGFQLIPHASAVDDFDLIEADPSVDARYDTEMIELLTRVTGASRVVMLGGGKKRHGEGAVENLAPLTNAKPARYPHGDNTDESATALAELFDAIVDDLDLTDYSRYAIYNVWRCVTPPPQDIPLAVCDARSIKASDEVTVTAVTATSNVSEIRHDTTSYVYNPDHRWFYFPGMTRDEVVIFKSHDTDPDRARRVPHTAFDDPTCPPDTHTRASVEARGLALFP
jgi:hypothetical protein